MAAVNVRVCVKKKKCWKLTTVAQKKLKKNVENLSHSPKLHHSTGYSKREGDTSTRLHASLLLLRVALLCMLFRVILGRLDKLLVVLDKLFADIAAQRVLGLRFVHKRKQGS